MTKRQIIMWLTDPHFNNQQLKGNNKQLDSGVNWENIQTEVSHHGDVTESHDPLRPIRGVGSVIAAQFWTSDRKE